MKKVIVLILITITAIIAAILIFAATKPGNFSVERTTTINAAPEKIFALINDFHSWGSWSPYEKLDPEMKRIYSGSENGLGAVYSWEGNNKVGSGRMEITASSLPGQITIKLDFLKPFEGHNVAEFTLVAENGTTNVTWAMHGPANFVSKVMQVFLSMDSLIGKDFEAGLFNLKTIAEK